MHSFSKYQQNGLTALHMCERDRIIMLLMMHHVDCARIVNNLCRRNEREAGNSSWQKGLQILQMSHLSRHRPFTQMSIQLCYFLRCRLKVGMKMTPIPHKLYTEQRGGMRAQHSHLEQAA